MRRECARIPGESRILRTRMQTVIDIQASPTSEGKERDHQPKRRDSQYRTEGDNCVCDFSRQTCCTVDVSVAQQSHGQRNKCTASTQATDTYAATRAHSSPAHLCGHVVCCGYEVAQCSRSFIIQETPKVGRCQSHKQQKCTSHTRFVGGCRLAAQFGPI